MFDLSSFLFAQIDKIFEKKFCPHEYLQHQWIFFSNTLHMHVLQTFYKFCEVSSGSNSKWPTYRYFCLLKTTKYLKMLSVRINISNTNKKNFGYFTHAFITILPWILWSFVRINFKMADLLPFLFAQIDKIFKNFVCPDKYLHHQRTFLHDTLHMHLLPSSHESL